MMLCAMNARFDHQNGALRLMRLQTNGDRQFLLVRRGDENVECCHNQQGENHENKFVSSVFAFGYINHSERRFNHFVSGSFCTIQ